MFLIKVELAIIAFLFLVVGLAISANYGCLWALPFWCVCVVMVLFFRHPKRSPPLTPWSVVAPIDGYVDAIFCAKSPLLDKEMTVVRLVRKHMGVMALYSPMQGQLIQTWYGEQYERVLDEYCVDEGHIYTAWLKNKENDDLLISFFRSKSLRYLEVQSQPGERVGQGREIGVSSIRYLDIFLPNNTKLKIKQGDCLRAGEHIIGNLIHKKDLGATKRT